MGQDGEDGQGGDGLTRFDFEVELTQDRRYERQLLVKELLVILVIALLVTAGLLFAR